MTDGSLGAASTGIPDPRALARAQQAAIAISARLSRLAVGLETAAGALPNQVPDWAGPAAEAMAALLSARPQTFATAAAACRSAAGALSRHAETLSRAQALCRAAEQTPDPQSAIALGWRSSNLVAESAQRAATELQALAGAAPTTPTGWRGQVHRAETWRSEILLGTAESGSALLFAALAIGVRVSTPPDPKDLSQVPAAGKAVLQALRHPLESGRALLDWDTWRHNPARAIGHLVPDLLTAGAGKAATGSVRITSSGNSSSAARQAAAAQDAARRQATATTAQAARQALVSRAQAEAHLELTSPRGSAAGPQTTAAGPGTHSRAWHGEGGTRLSATQNVTAETFHRLSTAAEGSLTAAMHALATVGRGELAGLEHRLKAPESYKRKVATAQATRGTPLPTLLAEIEDTIRYTVVIDEKQYVSGVAGIATAMERRGLHAQQPNNAWHSNRYRGINSTWLDPTTGSSFEVQFHTPASWQVTRDTHDLYEELRLPDTPAQRKAELHTAISKEYQQVPIPGWVQTLRGDGFPPATLPLPGQVTVDPGTAATVAGATGAGSALTGTSWTGTSDQDPNDQGPNDQTGRQRPEGVP